MDGQELAKKTPDQVPRPDSNAKRIFGLVKEGGRITGVGIAHRVDPEFLKSMSCMFFGLIPFQPHMIPPHSQQTDHGSCPIDHYRRYIFPFPQ